MASTLVQFRTEDTEKMKSIQILERLGLTLPSYLRMCMSRLNQKIGDDGDPGIDALKRASRIAKEYGTSDMTLDEINAEIAEARK